MRLLDMLGDDDVKARFLESWSRGAGAAQVTPPAPSLHPACTQPAPSLHPRPLLQHTPPPHSLQALHPQTLLPLTPSARPRPLQALPAPAPAPPPPLP